MLCDQKKISNAGNPERGVNFHAMTTSYGEEFSNSAGSPTIARLTDEELHEYVGRCKKHLQEFANVPDQTNGESRRSV